MFSDFFYFFLVLILTTPPSHPPGGRGKLAYRRVCGRTKRKESSCKKTKSRRDLFPQIAGPSPRKRTSLEGAAYGTDWQNSKPAWPFSRSRARVFFVSFGSSLAGTETRLRKYSKLCHHSGGGVMMVAVDHDADDVKR